MSPVPNPRGAAQAPDPEDMMADENTHAAPPGDAPSGGWLQPSELDAAAKRQADLPAEARTDPSKRPPLAGSDYLQALHLQRASDRVHAAGELLRDFRLRGEDADALRLAAHVGGRALRGFAVVREADGRIALTRVEDGKGEVDWEGASPILENVGDAIAGRASQIARVRNQHLLRDGVEPERSYRPNPKPLPDRFRPVDGITFETPQYEVLDPDPASAPVLSEATPQVRAGALAAELHLLATEYRLPDELAKQLVEAPFQALAGNADGSALDETALVLWRVPGPDGQPRLAVRVHRWAPFADPQNPDVGPFPETAPGVMGRAQRLATFAQLVRFAQSKAALRWTAGDNPADTILRDPVLRRAFGPGYRSDSHEIARIAMPATREGR